VLLEKRGAYYDLYQSQFMGGEEESSPGQGPAADETAVRVVAGE
jgi:hypothetical protein